MALGPKWPTTINPPMASPQMNRPAIEGKGADMATREVAIPETVSHMKSILSVVDGCIESEGAVIELLGIGSLPENIHMFYAHRKPIHEKSMGYLFGICT